jgi:hypothetical protein
MTGAIGISSQGIDFNALDKKPVHIIFLFAACEKRGRNTCGSVSDALETKGAGQMSKWKIVYWVVLIGATVALIAFYKTRF